jgi:CBS domain-containing protein
MTRTDTHLDATLRHLGAAYYDSLHGRATRVDVARALDTVAEQLNEHSEAGKVPAPRQAPSGQPGARDGRGARRSPGWSRTVGDVMTSSVVTIDRETTYKEIDRLLAEHRISGVPVLKMGRVVVGVVTEGDLLATQVATANRLRSLARPAWWRRARRRPALIAGRLMTSPAVTIGPEATVPAAARLMDSHHIGMLPVVDGQGKIAGIVSRRDLLRVFLRPDADIAADIRNMLDEILPGEADVSVRNGIVTLTGTPAPEATAHDGLLPLAIRLMWNVDGVVDIVDRLGEPRPAPRA